MVTLVTILSLVFTVTLVTIVNLVFMVTLITILNILLDKQTLRIRLYALSSVYSILYNITGRAKKSDHLFCGFSDSHHGSTTFSLAEFPELSRSL